MRKSFIQRLQRVRFTDILHILLFLAAIIPAAVVGKMRHIWMVSEVPDEARDNGYWFFKYMRENHPEIDCIYAINKKSLDYGMVAALGETVQFGSFMHWVYYLACDVKISSQKSGRPDDAVCYLLDRVGLRKKEVFLQHGVIKDDLPYIHADSANFSLFITSTEREYLYVKKKFGFLSGVVKTGLCRFDDLYDRHIDNCLIAIVPTWRQWIAHPDIRTKEAEQFHGFQQTEYFREWNRFLHSEELYELLDKHGMHAVFYLHRHMQKFADNFMVDGLNGISIATFPDTDVHMLLKEAAILVTDYSSVAMDFAYMDKPIVYYQFDQERFREYHLPKGYFDYKRDGFGPVVKDVHSAVCALEDTLSDKDHMRDLYKQRAELFFDLKDADNCKRTYEAIIQMLNGGKT